MKKFRVIFLFGLMAPFLLRANPFAPPPYLGEIYFEGDEWFIELILSGDFHSDLDNFRIVCSSDTAQFKPGIDLYGLEWILITQDSMLSSLSINKFGDFIEIEQGDDGYWWPLGMPIYFGDIEYSYVNYPLPGQSIVNTLVYEGYDDYYWTVKDNSPTLGSSFFQTTTAGVFSGRVLDQNLEPVSDIQIKYCNDYLLGQILHPIFTDDGGFFAQIMFGRNYEISFIHSNSSLLDTTVTIEPDSMTWCNYYLDTVLLPEAVDNMKTLALSFKNFPNPFSDNTTFVIQLPEDTHYQEGRIIVYDMTGREVYDRIIGQEITDTAPVFHHWDLAGNPAVVSPGEYISCLVLDGIVVAKNKSICIR
ncbi:MAG: hypothetical protein PHD61_07210 [Bacteroidales bacterium]|nr:hypothetical protein [Lentimicrobiaceae bacterium]MDD5695078.1 hypothetical protein [Bacteroidales bacterium]